MSEHVPDHGTHPGKEPGMFPKDDDLLRPPPPSMAATPYERRKEDAERMARYDAQLEVRAEQRRKDQAEADTEAFATARMAEWIDAGGTEADFRVAWPQMFAGHLSAKRALEEAQRQRLIDEQRVF